MNYQGNGLIMHECIRNVLLMALTLLYLGVVYPSCTSINKVEIKVRRDQLTYMTNLPKYFLWPFKSVDGSSNPKIKIYGS